MAVNKIVMNTTDGEQTLIDLTGDSVTPETLAEGVTAHDASGEKITGTMPTPYIFTGVYTQNEDGEYAVTLDDNYNWDKLAQAIANNRYVGCMLWDDYGDTPISFSLCAPYIGDSYAVFHAVDEGLCVYGMYIGSAGAELYYYGALATQDYVDNNSGAGIISIAIEEVN